MGLVNLLGATRSPWPIQVFQVAKMDVLCNTRRYSRVDFLMHRLPNIFFTLVFCLQFRYLKHPLKKSFRNSEEDLSRRVFPWVGRWLRYDFFLNLLNITGHGLRGLQRAMSSSKAQLRYLPDCSRMRLDLIETCGVNPKNALFYNVLHVQEWSDSERPWVLRCSWFIL